MICSRLAGSLFVLVSTIVGHADEPQGGVPTVGYTQYRCNLAGGRHANIRTMRATISRIDGSERQMLCEDLIDNADAWTQFVGWSPDRQTAIVARGWQSPANAEWEEAHNTFRFTAEGWSLDSFLVDLKSRVATNVTAVDRVSFYNGGLFFWPGNANQLGFTALIDGQSHPFRMDLDGRKKVDLTSGKSEFTYGFSSSPDGKRIAYHKNYQVYVADADGTNPVRIETGHPFNFAPSWSADSEWVLFVSGEHYNCHPYVVRSDGTELKKLADRGGYKGVIELLDVPDFHGGSSDVPIWAINGKSVYYTAQVGPNVELFEVFLDGEPKQLTSSAPGTQHYHPSPSPDGHSLAYGSKRDGCRQLYVRRLSDQHEQQITDLKPGHAAMWFHWQPKS